MTFLLLKKEFIMQVLLLEIVLLYIMCPVH